MALAGAAVVTASGWALQTAALPPPKPAARVAADASVWFHEYRLVVAVLHFRERRFGAACVRGWYPRRNGGQIRASLLAFRPGPVVRIAGRRRVSLVGGRVDERFPPWLLAAEAACSRLLAQTLAGAAQTGGHLTTERGYAANQPAVALELQRGREGRVTLYVSPRTYRPLVAFVDLDRRKITARIYLLRVRRRVLARFGLLGKIEPEPTL